MKKTGSVAFIILFICYVTATIQQSDFWGNLLSPVISMAAFIVTWIAFYYREENKKARLIGLLMSLGILSWALADTLWAVYAMILHVDPQNIWGISFLYWMTNLFFLMSLCVYGYHIFRKWNSVQVLLDSVIISFFVIDLIWICFLNENLKNIEILKTDWMNFSSIVFDVLIIIWLVIWYISSRNGTIPLYLRLTAGGVILYAVTDLIYIYQFFFATYEPNTFIDAVYELSFCLIAAAAALYINSGITRSENQLFNIGQNNKSYLLFIAPALLLLFRGFAVLELLKLVSVILIYYILSNYIQKNIYKEGLLKKEQEHSIELEKKVKERTEELVEKNEVLQHLLDQDFVTGLKNRRYLLKNLDTMVASLKDGERIVLLFIDINRFKMISTMYGQYICDMILYEMAEKLRPLEKMEDHTILTSYGDDSFIFAAVGSYSYTDGLKLSKEAIRLCSDIYQIEKYQMRITVNIGISIYPKDSFTKEELIRHADIAMSQARHEGFNCVRVFDANLSESVFRKNMIEIMLKKANFNQEFMIYFQPQLLAENQKLIGFEALLRWKTPSGEMISPGEFIPVAEETGYIISVGDWVMTMAMKQLVEWNRRFKEKIMIGINVSLKQLNSTQFVDNIKENMDRLAIKPEWIDLEITESLQLHDNPEIFTILNDIRSLGIKISIDDFGTGYSSLSYFKNLPIDRIKIAKELVDYIHISEFDYKLAEAIILLSKAKGIRVIAEGVETKEQWEVLCALKCDEVQGFYFGKPEPASIIEAAYKSKMQDIRSLK